MDCKKGKRNFLSPLQRLSQIFKGSSIVTILFLLLFYVAFSFSSVVRRFCVFAKPLTRKIDLFAKMFKPASNKINSKVGKLCDEYNLANKRVERFFFKFIPASDQKFSQYLFHEDDERDAFERKLINLNCSINLALAEIETCKFFIKSLLVASEKHMKYQKMLREAVLTVKKSLDDLSLRNNTLIPIINLSILKLDQAFKELPK